VLPDEAEAGRDALLDACVAAAQSCHWWCPFENAVLLSDRPAEVHLQDGQLHRDGGPAVRWRDGLLTWALHGVVVSREIAETPFDRLDALHVIWERNAEVRREILRKIGIERLCRDLRAKRIDKQGDYELLISSRRSSVGMPRLGRSRVPSTVCWPLPAVLCPLPTVSAVLLLESPPSFRARNLFVSENALSRV
jgi:hypothetical protein